MPEMYAILPKQTGRPGGTIVISWGSFGRSYLRPREAEIGYWIGRPFWGKGFATQALDWALERCFLELGRSAVWCGYYEGNEASRRVQEKCGMTWVRSEERTWCPRVEEYRTEHFTRITRKEWKERHSGHQTKDRRGEAPALT